MLTDFILTADIFCTFMSLNNEVRVMPEKRTEFESKTIQCSFGHIFNQRKEFGNHFYGHKISCRPYTSIMRRCSQIGHVAIWCPLSIFGSTSILWIEYQFSEQKWQICLYLCTVRHLPAVFSLHSLAEHTFLYPESIFTYTAKIMGTTAGKLSEELIQY